MRCTEVDDVYSVVWYNVCSIMACTTRAKGKEPQHKTKKESPSCFVCRSRMMSGNGSDSDGVHPRAQEAVHRKIKYTLKMFDRINVHKHNVVFKFKDGAVKLSYDEGLTEGTRSDRLFEFWLATPYPIDTERARVGGSGR